MSEPLTKTDHPYYCSESNFYSNDAAHSFATVTDFLDHFEDADEDMNLCFRFDIKESYRNDGTLCAEFFLILQRKGIFKPISCSLYDPIAESDRLRAYLDRHWLKMKELWAPIQPAEPAKV